MGDATLRPALLDDLALLADAIRSRLLHVLDGHELTVSELCSILQLPQSTVSRHLKTLAGAGWVRSRPDGPRRLYQFAALERHSRSRELWRLARRSIAEAAVARQDAHRLEAVLAERRARSRAFFDSSAGRWDRLRDELFGGGFWLQAIAGLLPHDAAAGDLGCGTGAVADTLAPFVASVVAVDESAAMLEAARRRLERHANVRVERSELETLALDDRSLDLATLVLVLHHVPRPARVLGEVARVLRPGGRLLVVDMLAHDREHYRQEMGHVWLGFEPGAMRAELERAGLEPTGCHVPPADPGATGPGLFVQTARRPADGGEARADGDADPGATGGSRDR